jgi:hypothetical protein
MSFQEVSHHKIAEYAEIIYFFFSAFSHRGAGPMPYGPEAEISAVNFYVSFSIKLAAFQVSGGADTRHLITSFFSLCRCYAGLLPQAVPNDNNKKAVNNKIIKEEHYGSNNPAANDFILSD